MAYAAIGSSLAAAIIVAVAFAIPGIWTQYLWRKSKLITYHIVGFAALARVAGMAIRAASITNDEANKAMMIAYFMCNQAGFSIMLDMQCYAIANWFKNTDRQLAPPLSSLWQKIAMICGPLAICTGLGLGVPSAILLYGSGSDSATTKAYTLRKAIATGMTSIATVCAILSVGAWLWTIYHHHTQHSKTLHTNLVHQKIWVLFISGLCLIWSGAVRVHIAYFDFNMTSHEERWFPSQELPELLQLLFWCWPYIMVEAHYSSKTNEYWENVRSGNAQPGELAHSTSAGGLATQPSRDSSATTLAGVSGDVQTASTLDMVQLSKGLSKELALTELSVTALSRHVHETGRDHTCVTMSESTNSEEEEGEESDGKSAGSYHTV